MTAYTEFFPYVLPQVADCPEILVEQQLREAAIEFCERTDFVRTDLSAISVVAGTGTYTVTPPADQDVARIMEAYYGVLPLVPVSEDELRIASRRDWRVEAGTPCAYFQPDHDHVTLYPKPDVSQAGALRLRVSVRPTRTASACPDVLFTRYVESIAAGAVARLAMLPGQPFFDPQRAAVARSVFDRGVFEAVKQRLRSLGRPVMRVRPHGGSL